MNLEENQGPSVDKDFAQLLSDNVQKCNTNNVGRIETFNRANSLKFITNKHSNNLPIKATEIITSLTNSNSSGSVTNTEMNITSDERFQIFSGANVHRVILPDYPIGVCKKRPKKRLQKVDFDYPIGVCKKRPKKKVRKVDFDYPIGVCKKRQKKTVKNNPELPCFPIFKARPIKPKKRKQNPDLPRFPFGNKKIKRPRKKRIPNRSLPQYPIGKPHIKHYVYKPSPEIFPADIVQYNLIKLNSPSIVISSAKETDPDDPIIKNIGVNVNALINMFTFAPSPDDV